MVGANHEFVGENNPPNHQNQSDGVETSVTPEGSAAHAQATPLDVPPKTHQVPPLKDPLVVPQVPQGAPMEVVMAALVNTINRQGQLLREQADNMRGQNELIREQNRRIRAVEDSSPRPTPRRNAKRPLSPPRENPRRKNHSPPQRNNRNSPPRNKCSPPRRNNRSPPKNGEIAARGGNARHSPRRESSGSGDERHRGPLSRRIMDIPLPRGLEKPPTLDKYDGTTDPDEHVHSVETALDYRNLRDQLNASYFHSPWYEEHQPGGETYHQAQSTHGKSCAECLRHTSPLLGDTRRPLLGDTQRQWPVEATDKMKLYLLEEGLCEGTKFQEAVGIVEVQTLDAFFELAQRYIKWEDKQKASEVRRPRNFEVGGPSSQREQRRGDEKKKEGYCPKYRALSSKARESNSQNSCPQNQMWTRSSVVSTRAMGMWLKTAYISRTPLRSSSKRDMHDKYVDGQRAANNAPRQNQFAVDQASPEQNVEEENRVVGGVALAISWSEYFLPLPDNGEKEALDYLAAHLDGSWENFPGALVISGGGFNPLEKASPVGEIKITKVKESSVPLAFNREEVPGGSPNFQIPLLVRAKMANFDVRRILVDQGSSYDIMYSGLFKVLQLTEENLVSYVGSDLQGFNGSTTKPWGYVDLIVTFGENKAMKSVKVKFLVVNCPSLYNCIIGRPTLAELFAVSSTIHLKMKYYTKDGQVATINGDIEAARRCFEATRIRCSNFQEGAQARKEGDEGRPFDQGKLSHIPDGEFELVPLGEDSTKGIKIGADLPELVKRQLKACLRENAELIAWSAAEMPGIDPEVACHQLTIDPRASVVVQRRRKQSHEKAEAAQKAVKGLLEANFIVEA
ncbi:hypothetical protein TSUD_375060 [Trifolium subterraneum]|uniref:Uncharacterized protein n=1 Tax=Trifolium subterraneum TaxID=3900 RepID=A0A2Z6N5R7_TRISU|nr:hypothetical protein TSUD_375060 [Trifolium subterraneum]